MSPLEFSKPTPTSIRIVRSFDASVDLVWRAYTEPELIKQWMTGPPDHSLPVCELDFRVGGTGRYVWKNPQFEMGMNAAFKEIVKHERIVHTESYEGWPEGMTTVTTQFVESDGRTTITSDIEYLNQEARDAAAQPGFKEGYEASFQTLDQLFASLDSAGPG